MSQWQDISTAPKDGTRVDLWVFDPDYKPGYRYPNAAWLEDGWQAFRGHYIEAFMDNATGQYVVRATHWMPVPSDPEAAA